MNTIKQIKILFILILKNNIHLNPKLTKKIILFFSLIGLFLGFGNGAHANCFKAFDHEFQFPLPGSDWVLVDKQIQTEKILYMYGSNKFQTKDKMMIDPSITIIVTKLNSTVKNILDFEKSMNLNIPVAYSERKELGGAVLFFYRWANKKKNNMFRLLELNGNLGIQSIVTVTAEKLDEYQNKLLNTISKVAVSKMDLKNTNVCKE